ALSPALSKDAHSACIAARRLCNGEFEELLRETELFTTIIPVTSVTKITTSPVDDTAGTIFKDLQTRVAIYIAGESDDENNQELLRQMQGNKGGGEGANVNETTRDDRTPSIWRAAETLWVGAAALNLFLQQNYTGPELGEEETEDLEEWLSGKLGVPATAMITPTPSTAHATEYAAGDEATPTLTAPACVEGRAKRAITARDLANVTMACDGELPYPHSGLVLALLVARVILSALVPSFWNEHASTLTSSDPLWGSQGLMTGGAFEGAARAAVVKLSSAEWWSGRSVVAHARLLLSADRVPTLWDEAKERFRSAVGKFGGGGEGDRGQAEEAAFARRLAARVWLEWGLAQHYFQDPSKGKASFQRAKEASGLTARLTGAMGKRTKYQQKQVAQLVLEAKSAFPKPAPGAEVAKEEEIASKGEKKQDSEAHPVFEMKAGVASAKPELGKSTATGAGGGGWGSSEEKAALRQVHHGEDSVLLEQVEFVDSALEQPDQLEDIDLAIILGLCLDVSNSNPIDGLTNEEMSPYINRVLRQPGCNWMVYSTALLQRAWVEFERSHARERSALQLQALVDQHTTKLTYTQSTMEV
ncbi:unnamed protein product, partial [Choristocarpus tenellus]